MTDLLAIFFIFPIGEKTKWMPVPTSELQFTTPESHSPSHSRTHSQHRRNKQTASRSRQQSQSRSISGRVQSGPNSVLPTSGNPGSGRLTGSHGSSASGEVSISHSRAESTSQSRATSVHSSPKLPPRGRRLPEDQNPGAYSSLSQIVSSVNSAFTGGPNASTRRPPITVLPNGDITEEETADVSAPVTADPASSQYQQPIPSLYADPTSSLTELRTQNPSGPQSQSHTPFTSHSPVYYPPPLAMPHYIYNGMPPYGAPPPPPPPSSYDHQQYPPLHLQSPAGSAHGHHSPHGYHPYSPYPLQPGQPHYPYMYHPIPYSFYPPQAPGQPHERPFDNNALPIQVQNQEVKVEGAANDTADQVEEGVNKLLIQSPSLPPPSLLTHPPPPDESAALAGYREVSAIPISPLLNPHRTSASIDAVASGSAFPSERVDTSTGGKKEEMVFGSVGRPGGIKSPSPAPQVAQGAINASLSYSEADDKQAGRTNTTFAVGIDGQDAERIKSRMRRSRGDTASGRYQATDDETNQGDEAHLDGAHTDTEHVIQSDKTTSAPKYMFGTSSESEDVTRTDVLQSFQNGQIQQVQEQILQPQPHQPPILHYPPNYPPPYAGYQVLPPPGVPVNIPIAMQSLSPSPQTVNQPLPQHIPSLHPFSVNPGFVSPLALSSPGPGSGPPSAAEEFLEVRDFGYGFGPMSGSGYAHERIREERFERERERERERDHREGFRNEPREFFGGGRGRRGSGSFERGGFVGRRGRGGPGFRGFPRGFGRGGHGGNRQQPPLNVSTNAINVQQPQVQSPLVQMQPPPSMPDGSEGFYPPPSSQGSSPYATSPYALFNPAPPLPQAPAARHPPPPPVTQLSFPLDPTSHNLLGQLEYYFSANNLAQDYHLRQKVGHTLRYTFHPCLLFLSHIDGFKRMDLNTTDFVLQQDPESNY